MGNRAKVILIVVSSAAVLVLLTVIFLRDGGDPSGITVDTGPQPVQHITENTTDLGLLSDFEISCYITYYYQKMLDDFRLAYLSYYSERIQVYQNELLLRAHQGGHDAD